MSASGVHGVTLWRQPTIVSSDAPTRGVSSIESGAADVSRRSSTFGAVPIGLCCGQRIVNIISGCERLLHYGRPPAFALRKHPRPVLSTGIQRPDRILKSSTLSETARREWTSGNTGCRLLRPHRRTRACYAGTFMRRAASRLMN